MLFPALSPTQIAPAPYRTCRGAAPTFTVAVIAFVAGSMRLTVPLNSLVAQTDAGTVLHVPRLGPTGIRATTFIAAGSIRSTAPVP